MEGSLGPACGTRRRSLAADLLQYIITKGVSVEAKSTGRHTCLRIVSKVQKETWQRFRETGEGEGKTQLCVSRERTLTALHLTATPTGTPRTALVAY